MKSKILLLFILWAGVVSATAGTVEEVWIDGNGMRIFGMLSKPDSTSAKQPIAIVSHGFNGDHRFGINYAELFNSLGFQLFTFDFPHGSQHSRSAEGTLDMSIIDEQQALETVVRHFKSQPDIDGERIVLIGESQGGLVSALVAANPSVEISDLILVYPALCIPDNWNSRYPEIEDIPEVTKLWGVELGRRFFTELRYLSPFDIIGRYKGRVQIIQGDKDPVVPVDYSKKAAEIYEDCRLHIIKGAGHGFKGDELEESKSVMRDFLLSQQ